MSTINELQMGYGEEKENALIRKQEMLICGLRSGKNCTILQQETFWWKWSKGTLHREKKEMSHFEKFVTEGNEKADELAKADEGFMAETRAKTVQQ